MHYGRNYVNAFWSDACFCMTFGDGDNGASYCPLVALDVAGHEMTHGVTSRTANLVYSGESGGLNEATSDIFGTMVEFHTNNANDTPDYLIGEKIYASNPGNPRRCAGCSSPAWTAPRRTATSASIGASTCITARAWPTTSTTCLPKVRWCPRASVPALRRT